MLRKRYDNPEVFKLKNPGVNVITLSLRSIPTPTKLEWEERLRKFQEERIYYKPKITYGYGDGMITTNSIYYGPLKWAWEYEKNQENSKAMKIIDICSTYNVKDDPWDNSWGEREINKNEFFGIECECQNDDSPYECDHANIMADKYVLKVAKNILLTHQ